MKRLNINLLVISLALFAQVYADVEEVQIPDDYEQVECELKSRTRRPTDYASSHPHLPLHASTSDNWSGYAALTDLVNPKKGSVDYVAGTWNVPQLTPTPNNSYSATWVGIDGFVSPTVEQLGTEHDWIDGAPSYYAWFEMYPRDSFEIRGFPVNVGDSITATVKYTRTNEFTLTIMNNTKKKFFQVPRSFTKSNVAQRSSAEWVVEAPFLDGVLPLAHFSKVTFSNCVCTINKVLGAINNKLWKNDAITMVEFNTGTKKAVPSPLTANGKGFNVTWLHE